MKIKNLKAKPVNAVAPKAKQTNLILIARVMLVAVAGIIVWAYLYNIPYKLHFSKSDQVLHFTGFFGFGTLIAISLPKIKKLKVITTIIFFAVSLEISQPILTTGRKLSLSDMIANSSGGVSGYLVGAVLVFIAMKFLNRISS